MEHLLLNEMPLIIAGPCALESREQIRIIVSFLKSIGLSFIRAPLWKPRTHPGWDGLGWTGFPLLMEETLTQGMIPAIEILSADHARMVVDCMKIYGSQAKILVWLGARNQNHFIQMKIAEILKSGPEGIFLMFKNQMWDDEKHWLGIYKHIISSGFPTERLLTCHRGFSPGKMDNPRGYRNLPDFEMAMRIREATALPVILDPSHIAGDKDKVFEICRMAAMFDFDGYLIEIHENPNNALTDAKQQLSFDNFLQLLSELNALPVKKDSAINT